MKKQIDTLALACITAIVFVGCATSHGLTGLDYKVIEGNDPNKIDQQLSQLGRDGWVVVSSSSSATAGNIPPEIVVILRRNK